MRRISKVTVKRDESQSSFGVSPNKLDEKPSSL